MKSCVLRFPGHAHADLVLSPGATGIGRDPDHERGLRTLPLGEASLLEIVLDARGIWMSVAEGTWGVHVNGRPVQRIAMLNAGDTLHVEGMEMQLVCATQGGTVEAATSAPLRPRQWEVVPVLRGLGGKCHGQALPVRMREGQPLMLDGVSVELDGQDVIASCTAASARLTVNGEQASRARLRIGDQLVLPHGQRFLLEGPDPRQDQGAPVATAIDQPAPVAGAVQDASGFRPPWLLLAAVGIALVLLALFWFGV